MILPPPGGLPPHESEGRPCTEECAIEVDRNRLHPGLDGHLIDECARGKQARIVKEQVQSAMTLKDRLEQCIDLGGLRDISPQDRGRRMPSRRLLERGQASASKHNLPTIGQQRPRAGPSNATACSGDQGDSTGLH